MRLHHVTSWLPLLFLGLLTTSVSAQITEILDSAGDNLGNSLESPTGVAVDAFGNVFITGQTSNNGFRIAPDGTITEIIDAGGDQDGNTLRAPFGVATDALGNVFVTSYFFSLLNPQSSVFKITPTSVITEIIDETGDGTGNELDFPVGVATDDWGNVFVAGFFSNNVFKITPEGSVTEIIDQFGDGIGNSLSGASGLATDASGNVFVSGNNSDNAFKISPGGIITEIIDIAGESGVANLQEPTGVAADDSGNVFVAGEFSDNLFRITPGGIITEILDSSGDGHGNILDAPIGVATDAAGNVFVTGSVSDNVFMVAPNGTITEILDASGDGVNTLIFPYGVAVSPLGGVIVAGQESDNAFRIECLHPISTRILLEGPFSGEGMSTALRDGGYVPLSQPFSDSAFEGTALEFDDTLTVAALPDSVVDWVLVSLFRSSDSTHSEVSRHAALLYRGGTIATPGDSAVCIDNSGGPGQWHLVVRSRNHLDVMSAGATWPGHWDFTSAPTQAWPGNNANALKELATGIWGMFAGDPNGDGNVTAPDFNLWNASTTAGETGYLQADCNLDGFVTAPDFNLWNANTVAGASSKVPD